MALTVNSSAPLPGEHSPAGISRFGPPGAPDTTAARERAQAERGGALGLPPSLRSQPMGDSPLLRGLDAGGPAGGVSLRGASRPTAPQDIGRGDTVDNIMTMDKRAGTDRRKIDDLGHRAMDGLIGADRDNLRLNYNQQTGAMSIDRQFVDDKGKAEWRNVWNGNAPAADHKNPSVGWAVATERAGNALAESYRNQPYNNRAPLDADAFRGGVRDAIDGISSPRPRDWGLPNGTRRS